MNAPAHISPAPGSKRHLCGVKSRELPYVGAAHVQAHIDGWTMPVCPDCWAVHTVAVVSQGSLFPGGPR